MTEFTELSGIAVILMAIAAFRLRWLMFPAGLFWLFAGLWIRGLSVTANSPAGTPWDIYYGMYFFCLFMVLACVLLPVAMRDKKAEEPGDVYVDDVDRAEEYNEKLWKATRAPRVGRSAAQRQQRRER